MNWVLTNAQIEMIASDVSVVDYDCNDKKKKHKRGEFDSTKADPTAVRKANEAWLSRYGNQENAGSGLSVDDILGNGMVANIGVRLE